MLSKALTWLCEETPSGRPGSPLQQGLPPEKFVTLLLTRPLRSNYIRTQR